MDKKTKEKEDGSTKYYECEQTDFQLQAKNDDRAKRRSKRIQVEPEPTRSQLRTEEAH